MANCGHGTASLEVNESYATTHGTSVSVGINTKFGFKSGDLDAEVGASVSYSSSWSKAHTLGRQVTVSVPHGYEGWIDGRPNMRTVPINPVFRVNHYVWNDSQSEVGTEVHSRRGRGYDPIWSFAHYVSAYADVVNSHPDHELRRPRQARHLLAAAFRGSPGPTTPRVTRIRALPGHPGKRNTTASRSGPSPACRTGWPCLGEVSWSRSRARAASAVHSVRIPQIVVGEWPVSCSIRCNR
nr:hypothetical protein [Streptomyces sp. MBT53]